MRNIVFFALFIFKLAIISAQSTLVEIPAGQFQMGNRAGDQDEKPEHTVNISSFRMAAVETTWGEFRDFTVATGYITDAEKKGFSYSWDSLGWHLISGVNWRHDERGKLRTPRQARFPVVHVSWNDAANYCNWRSRQENLQAVYQFLTDTVLIHVDADGYRLPTEAEWEYAAGSSNAGLFSGSGPVDSLAWHSGNARHRAHPVGKKRPNRLGLFDVTGNVWEWCQDYYSKDYYLHSKNLSNPTGPSGGAERVLRGGSWNNTPRHCRNTNRSSRFPDFSDGNVGFRIARKS